MDRLAQTLSSIARSVRTILGAPDYDRYLAHMGEYHGGSSVLTRDEFARDRADTRYNRPGSRCC